MGVELGSAWPRHVQRKLLYIFCRQRQADLGRAIPRLLEGEHDLASRCHFHKLDGPLECEFSINILFTSQSGVGCTSSFLHALNYSQVAGLCAGMITLGLIVDRIGRKWGSVTTAGIMFVGK